MTRIHQLQQKVKYIVQHDRGIILIFLWIVAGIYSFISITLHNHYMTFGLDLGVFDESVWRISQGKFPYSGVGCNWLLEDHFQIIFYMLAPLFWIWDNVRILLIAQAFAMVYAGFPLYLLAKRITKNALVSFSIVLAYEFFLGTQFAILNELHQITFAPVCIAYAYLFLERKQLKKFLFCICLLFIIKEDLSLFIATMGLGLVFARSYRRLGITLFLTGTGLFFFLIYIFMPFVSLKATYDHFHFGPAGDSPQGIVVNVVKNPLFFFQSMVSPPVKIQTAFRSFYTFAFLPLVAPPVYSIPLFIDFVFRFIYAGPQFTKWGLVNHHASVSTIMLAICTIYALRRITHYKVIIGIILIGVTISGDILFHGPVNSLLKRQFYEREQWMKDNDVILAKIPSGVSVAAQNNIAPHLTHRETVYRLPYGSNSEYIVVDFHDGPNKYAPLGFKEMKTYISKLLATQQFSVIASQGDSQLLRRNFKKDIKTNPYYADTRYCYYSFEENE